MGKIFSAIFNLRYVAVLAVITPFLGAVLMILLGTKDTIDAYLIFFGLEEPEGAISAGESAMIKLVASIDHFLFSAILMIFAIGLYALFFRSGSQSSGENNSHKKNPSWKHLKNMGGMDEMLLKVIIMLLAVSFLEFMLTVGMGALNWTVLVVPLTIVALAIGLKWMSAAAEQEERDEAQITAQTSNHHPGLDELERLADLRDRGALTDVEFEEAKKKIHL